MPRLLQLNLLVLLWSFTGILGEVVSLGTPALVFWRTALASVGYYLLCRSRPSLPMRLEPSLRKRALISGFILGVHWLCFFGAIAVSNVSIGLAGFASMALFTAILEPIWERKRPCISQITLALIVAFGLVLIASAETDVTGHHLGLALAFLGTILAVFYNLISKHLVAAQVPGSTMMLYQMPASCAATLLAIALIPAFRFEVPLLTDWPAILFLSLICTVVAYLWFARLLKNVPIYTISLALNFEPVYGMIMAAFLFKEYASLGPLFYLGSALIVLANVLHSRKKTPPSCQDQSPA